MLLLAKIVHGTLYRSGGVVIDRPFTQYKFFAPASSRRNGRQTFLLVAPRRLSNRESSLLQPNNQTEALRVPAFRVWNARALLEDDKIREEGPQPQRPVVEAARAVLERKRPSSRRRSRVQHSTAHSMWLTSAAAVTITTSTTAASASHYTYHFAASIIWPPLHDSIDSKIELIR